MKEIKWKKGIRRLCIPVRETDALKAFALAEKMKLPKHRLMGFEMIRYKDKEGYYTYPQVYIEK